MKRISRLALLFGLLFTVLISGPALLSGRDFGPYPFLTWGDILDLFTPLLLLPLYWLLFQLSPDQRPGRGKTILFMVLAAAWAMGQGMHLGANAIGHLLDADTGGDAYELTYYLDEVLSHYIWHLAFIALSALILYRQRNHPFAESGAPAAQLAAGALLYGLTYALAILEGGTALFGVPFAILAALFLLRWGRDRDGNKPLDRYFLIAYLFAALVFIAWGLYWTLSEGAFYFPQPSEVGLI
jgi:hypothetical protein